MAGGSALVLLIDEIATMVKVTAEKTVTITKPVGAGGESNKQNSVYFKHDTGLILDIAKGSLKNKALLVPAALALNFLAPWAVLPLVAAGGVYFSRTGIQKLRKTFKGETEAHARDQHDTVPTPAARARKIKEALRTDMVLSAEIVAITLAFVAAMPFAMQAAIMSGVAVGATVGAYTVITGIIKMEDLGGWMANSSDPSKAGQLKRAAGKLILDAKPRVMNGISAAGTAAIFMVGGGLMFHGIPAFGAGVSEALAGVISSPYVQSAAKLGIGFLTGLGVGLSFHAAETGVKTLLQKVMPDKQKKAAAVKQKLAAHTGHMQQKIGKGLSYTALSIKQFFNKTASSKPPANDAQPKQNQPNQAAADKKTPQNKM
ncbi:MAG: DUF808 family protein [Alphaproteobacteria bacterium]